MASITYDGRSFMLDGKRIWLVSGTICPSRTPRDHWADRLNAARLAGLNTILVPVVWARHEPRPGHFDFKGDNDIRHFVELIARAGMYCILKPGPYIGDDFDLGGIPAWAADISGQRLRANHGGFLEACSRYLTALADQVRSLQISAPGAGGPIILIQNESAWTCGHEAIAQGYLGELVRYLREAGLTVPLINANSLWQSVEGEVDCWSGTNDMLSSLRQLASVRADQPRLIIDFFTGAPGVWNEPRLDSIHRHGRQTLDPWVMQRRLAEVLAGGGQFNLQPFHGGTSFGFSGGRLASDTAAFVTSSHDVGAPLTESGAAGASFNAVRRIATFASRFGRVLAHLDPVYQPVVIDPAPHSPDAARKGRKPGPAPSRPPISVVHTTGSQGGVAFVFAGDTDGSGHRSTTLLLADGSSLPVELGSQSVVWCLLDVHIGGRATLDYSSLCALGVVGKVLVVFGPAGARGVLSINGSPLDVVVPTGKAPLVEEHENLAVVVCSEEMADTTFFSEDAVYVGVAGLTSDGRPIPLAGVKHYTKISAEGVVSSTSSEPVKASADRATIGAWSVATLDDYVSGVSERFASIPQPADLTALGTPYGYGWYRISMKGVGGKKARLVFPRSGDRLTVFQDGVRSGVIGYGPGATSELAFAAKKPATTLVVLAENLGRFSEGLALGEQKGLFGHGYEADPIKLPKPKYQTSEPFNILAYRAPVWEVREGDTTLPDRITWTIQHRKRTSLVVRTAVDGAGFPGRAVLFLNNKPVNIIDRGWPAWIVLDVESLSRGNNVLQLALLPDSFAADFHGEADAALAAAAETIRVLEIAEPFTAKAEWAFAKWEPPQASAFQPAGRAAAHGPAWWKTSFEHSGGSTPVFFDLNGLGKGQLYVNGQHLGRFFAMDPAGKPVSPAMQRLFIPPSLLRAGKGNEILIFDENGASPAKTRLVYDTEHPPVGVRPGGK